MNERPAPGDRPNGSASERRSLILALARGWLLVGSPSNPVDPRRRIGSHRRLKDILLGTAESRASRDPWARFSGAMDRQALEEALAALGEEQLELVGLAYFEGRTNKVIANQLGLSVATVQRRLRAAIQSMSQYLRERGAGTWSLITGQGLLEGRRWRSWLDGWPWDQLATPVRDLAQTAAGALVVVAVVGAGAHLPPGPAKSGPLQQPGLTSPHRVLTEPVATAPASELVVTAAARPAPQEQKPPVRLGTPTLPATGAATTAATKTLGLVTGTVSAATGVNLPSPPSPPPLP